MFGTMARDEPLINIVGGLWSGLSCKRAAHFSFIIAVLMMVAAVSYDLMKTASVKLNDFTIITGFLGSFLTALIAVKTFLKLLSKFKLIPLRLPIIFSFNNRCNSN